MVKSSHIVIATVSCFVLFLAPLAGGWGSSVFGQQNGHQNSVLWARQFGSTSGEGAHAIAVGPSGDVFVGGRTAGVVGDASFGRDDSFLQRLDSCGNEVWSTQLGTSASDSLNGLSIGSGNIFSVGHTVTNGSDPNDFDAYVSLTDFDGNVIWQNSYGTTAGDIAQGAASNTSGEHFVAGYTRGSIGGAHLGGDFDGFLTKFDDDGNVVWETQIGTDGSDLLFSVELDSAGNAYVVGETGGVFAGNTSSSSSSIDDAFLLKVDNSGNVVWVRQFGTSNNDVANDVVVTENDEIFVTGSLSAGNFAFVRKYGSDGTLIWDSTIGGLLGAPDSIAVNDRGEVVVLGDTFNDFGGTNAGSLDAFLIRLDESGNEISRFQFGSSEPEWGNAIAFDAFGESFYAAGQTRQTILGQSSVGSDDAYIVKFAPVDIVLDPNENQRSMLLDLEVAVHADVEIGPSAFSLVKRGSDGGPVSLNVSVNNSGSRTSTSLSFSGEFTESSGSLGDGNYQLTINGDDIMGCNGVPLDIDSDGIPGGTLVFGDKESDQFYRLFGDVNQSRRVDSVDLLGFRQTWLLITGDADFEERFDWNLNGVIDALDLLRFRGNWLKEMPFEESGKRSFDSSSKSSGKRKK